MGFPFNLFFFYFKPFFSLGLKPQGKIDFVIPGIIGALVNLPS
jgi:hypothetical protein